MTKRLICIQGPLCALLFLLSRGAELEPGGKLSFQVKATNTGLPSLLHREKRQLLFPNTTLLQLNIGVTVPTPAKDINCNWAFQANFQLPWNQTQIPTDIFMANSGYDGDSRVIRAKREKKDGENIEDINLFNTNHQHNSVGVETLDGKKEMTKIQEIAVSDLHGVYKSESRLTHLYKEVEKILDSFGYEGSSCVLRVLCQLAREPLHTDYNEDLLHELTTFVLDPSNGPNDIDGIEEDYPYLEAFTRGHTMQDCSAHYGCSLDVVNIFTTLKNN